jgi:aspartate/methionine/tyrosine aminotransferase
MYCLDNNIVVMIVSFHHFSYILNTCLSQGAVPQIIANTKQEYFNKILGLLRNSSDLLFGKIKDIRGITCPHKPEGSMFVMVSAPVNIL